jgi:hypothetical protein
VLGDDGGEARIEVRDPGLHIRDADLTYTVLSGPDPLTQRACYAAVLEDEEPRGPSSGARCAPEGEDYPDAVARLVGVMTHPGAADVMYSRSGTVDGGAGGTHGELDWEVTRIPLLFGGPGSASGTVSAAIRVVDIAPTILHALGFGVPEEMDGVVRCELLAASLC